MQKKYINNQILNISTLSTNKLFKINLNNINLLTFITNFSTSSILLMDDPSNNDPFDNDLPKGLESKESMDFNTELSRASDHEIREHLNTTDIRDIDADELRFLVVKAHEMRSSPDGSWDDLYRELREEYVERKRNDLIPDPNTSDSDASNSDEGFYEEDSNRDENSDVEMQDGDVNQNGANQNNNNNNNNNNNDDDNIDDISPMDFDEFKSL